MIRFTCKHNKCLREPANPCNCLGTSKIDRINCNSQDAVRLTVIKFCPITYVEGSMPQKYGKTESSSVGVQKKVLFLNKKTLYIKASIRKLNVANAADLYCIGERVHMSQSDFN